LTTKSTSVLVTSFGAVYRIPASNYRRQLEGIINGTGYNLPEGGNLGQIEANLSDLDADEAAHMLHALDNRLEREKRRPSKVSKVYIPDGRRYP
jgi:hypothetical protein